MSENTTAYVSETGGSDFAVRIAMGRHSMIGDETQELGGKDLGPSPYQLLAAALGECTAMTVRWFARQQKWPLDHVSVTISHRKDVVQGRAGKADLFEKIVILEGPQLSAQQRASLLEVAAKCPVQRTLEGEPVIRTLMGIDHAADAGTPA